MAQNITLLGASYTAVSAVTLPKTGGGTAKFSDASVTTAVESDVAEGKTFLLADGSIGMGTASGGGGSYTRTVVVPEQTVTMLSDTNWTLTTSNDSLVDGEEYIVTVNGVEKISTATTYVDIIYISFVDFDWGGTGYAFGTAVSGSGVYFCAKTAGTYTIKVEKLELTGSGGSGASNIVTGTFKGTTTGAAMDVDLDYSGSGYPLAIIIYPKEGAYNSNSDVYNLVQRYASLWFNAVKAYADVAPNYDNSGTDDQYTITNRTKNSSSVSTGYGTDISPSQIVASGGDAASTVQNVVKLKSNTKMSVYIASSSYGFPANIEFKYHVIYST